MNFAYTLPGGSCFFFTTSTNTSTTSSTLCKPLLLHPPPLLPFFSVPLLRLWAFQIDSDITLEACLLGWFACIPTYTSYEPFHRLELEKGGREEKKSEDTTKNQQPLFHYANNMLCCLHQIHPILVDSLILHWEKVIA